MCQRFTIHPKNQEKVRNGMDNLEATAKDKLAMSMRKGKVLERMRKEDPTTKKVKALVRIT